MQLFDYDIPLEPKHSIKPLIVISILFIAFFTASADNWSIINPSLHHDDYFRLLSGNFFHSNISHLLLNTGGLLLIWLFHAEHYSWRSYFSVLLLCCIGSSLAAFSLTESGSIIGLSGALHGMLIYGAIRDIIEKAYRQVGLIMLVAIVAKVIAENTIGLGSLSADLIGMRVAVEAHFFGSLSGIILGLASLKLVTKTTNTE